MKELRKGWFIIPGVQSGDRTLEEQMLALRPALKIAADKTVLDIGCAEGLVSAEFAKVAAHVHGIEYSEAHLSVARKLFDGHANLTFERCDLNKPPPVRQFDIVLALGVCHKLADPAVGVHFAAQSAREYLLLRSGVRESKGVINSKISGKKVHAHKILQDYGFTLEQRVYGHPKWNEEVQYFRR